MFVSDIMDNKTETKHKVNENYKTTSLDRGCIFPIQREKRKRETRYSEMWTENVFSKFTKNHAKIVCQNFFINWDSRYRPYEEDFTQP